MMITRSIALALLCACAYALSPNVPLHVVGDNNDCALYLSGPGRTSAYDYSINLLKGNFGYEGQTNCITYEAINQAYLEARNRILVAQPKGDWKAEDFASVGELILDISINLARRYGLTYEEIEKGLPLIDTSRTLIREVCPPVFSHVECRAGKYRRLDGLCNNLQHPTWGATMAPFQRLIGPLFADGINSPRIAHHGKDLPLSRVVSRTMHPDDGFHDHAGTVMVIAWGQFMDHDYTLTGTPLDPINRNDPEECCKRPPHLKHPYCNEIRIPDDDYFYRLFGVKCIDFVRGFPSPRPGCRLGSRNPFNTLTGTIDGNTVYGVTEKFARKLRTGFGGLLRMNPVFKEYGLKDLLPLKLDIPDEGCTRPNKNMYCFEAGEIRVNEQLVLTVMHTLMAREHNRVANALAEVNPHWDDETLFQEARRINIAEIQHITYNEFLPILLGKDVMEKFGLVLEKEGYWDGYDTEVNPDVIASFAAAAYRFGHSLLPTAVERWSKAHKFIASKRLSDLIRRPYDLYRAGVLDEYVMGLMNQVAQAMDDSITQEVTNHLFKKVGARFGMDLVSFNMQRGREFGLPGYMEFRKFCGLPSADTFQDLFGSMPNETVRKYETIFDHPIDVDLWSGGVSERPLPGSMLGPTFACIIATQFSYSKRGDRFWFELPNQPSSFTSEQLVEIRKSRLARVICDNTDIIDTVQLYPMVLPDHELNPRVPCRSGILPQMDFSKWAEPAPFHGPAKQFMTNATIVETNVTKEEHLTKDGKDCNQTEIIETITPNPDMLLLQAQNTNNTATSTETITESPVYEITNNTPVNQTHKKENEITDKDTVLKYVYKKGDKAVLDKNNNGHFRNSLKRRKRSAEDPLSPLPSKFQDSALIVNYETSHAPSASASWSSPNAPKTIKDAHLADFKIETRHDERPSTKTSEVTNLDKNRNENTDGEEYNQNNSRERPVNSNESGEQRDYTQQSSYPSRNRNSDESSEKDSRNNAKYSNKNDVSDESSEKYESREDRGKSAESSERERNDYTDSKKPYRGSEKYSHSNKPYESQHKSYPEQSEENSYKQNKESSEENIRENSNSKYNTKPQTDNYKDNPVNNQEKYREDSSKSSKENSDERPRERYEQDSRSYERDDREKSQENYRSEESSSENVNQHNPIDKNQSHNNRAHSNNRSSLPLQDIDLGDFSYERINLNEKGKVVAAKDNLELSDPNSAVELLRSNETKPVVENHDLLQLVTSIHTPFNANKLVNINDGEVRPVVELNAESDEESSEENNRHKQFGSLDFKQLPDYRNNDHRSEVVANKDAKSGDVKQQFERIPLNYNHNQNIQQKEASVEADNASEEENKPKIEEPPKIVQADNKENETPATESEGTVDVFAPDDVKYDDKLNFKFDDLHITLPEIRLPEDILAFTRSHSPFKQEDDEKENKKSHQLFDNDEQRKPKNSRDDNDDEDDDRGEDDRESEPAYYGYYGGDNKRNQDYKKKSADDDDYDEKEKDGEEDEDLYEKFVRERFGKRGSFGKRSEKLQARPLNPELSKTLQNVLKKTAVIDEQAKKSGDPNAGYAWTLEYGENL